MHTIQKLKRYRALRDRALHEWRHERRANTALAAGVAPFALVPEADHLTELREHTRRATYDAIEYTYVLEDEPPKAPSITKRATQLGKNIL